MGHSDFSAPLSVAIPKCTSKELHGSSWSWSSTLAATIGVGIVTLLTSAWWLDMFGARQSVQRLLGMQGQGPATVPLVRTGTPVAVPAAVPSPSVTPAAAAAAAKSGTAQSPVVPRSLSSLSPSPPSAGPQSSPLAADSPVPTLARQQASSTSTSRLTSKSTPTTPVQIEDDGKDAADGVGVNAGPASAGGQSWAFQSGLSLSVSTPSSISASGVVSSGPRKSFSAPAGAKGSPPASAAVPAVPEGHCICGKPMGFLRGNLRPAYNCRERLPGICQVEFCGSKKCGIMVCLFVLGPGGEGMGCIAEVVLIRDAFGQTHYGVRSCSAQPGAAGCCICFKCHQHLHPTCTCTTCQHHKNPLPTAKKGFLQKIFGV